MNWSAFHKDYSITCRCRWKGSRTCTRSTEVKWILTVGSLPTTEATRQACFVNGNVVCLVIVEKPILTSVEVVRILISIVMYSLQSALPY